MVLPARGLTYRCKGRFQGEVPLLGKERFAPTLMIPSATASVQARTLAQDAPQAHAHPAVHGFERLPTTVLEVSEPAPQRPVYLRDDARQAVSVRPLRLGTDAV